MGWDVTRDQWACLASARPQVSSPAPHISKKWANTLNTHFNQDFLQKMTWQINRGPIQTMEEYSAIEINDLSIHEKT
jgi:hypothetical protein